MSKDWKKIAKASGLAIPDAQLERIAKPLEALEKEFRPLVQVLPPETEPAPSFRAHAEENA